MLRYIREHEPIGHEQLDGRTAKALLARGLISLRRHDLSTTAAGRQALDQDGGQAPKRRRRSKNPARAARASALLSAVERLEALIPPGSEVAVGPILAGADDVLAGFRGLARKLE